MTAAELAERLRALNIDIGAVCEPNEEEDGQIVLSDTLYVQVGPNYFNLVLNIPEGKLRYFYCRYRFNALLNDLRRLAQDPTLQDLALRQALRRIP